MYRVKVGEKGVVYLPAKIREKLGIKKGGELLLEVRGDQVILRPVKTIFKLGIESRKISKISVEEFERESEEMQVDLYGS